MVCTARIGDSKDPLIPDSKADVILSLELLETVRALCKANDDTVVVASTETMVPLSVSTQKMNYPTFEEVRERVKAKSRKAVFIDSRKIAEEEGVPISSNIVMVGALVGTGVTGIEPKFFRSAIEMSIRRNIAENHKAFARGVDLGRQALG